MMRQKCADYLSLSKPRLNFFVIVTVAVAAYVASRGEIGWGIAIQAVLGTFLVAAGASALNQLMEKRSDALMKRTENRPLPAGRLSQKEVLAFGLAAGITGSLWLAIAVNAVAGFLACMTLASYVFFYTPLKRRTSLNTAIGAIPGALPAVIGWAASGESVLRMEAWLLFAIVFLWQFPHFFAIAWIYRDEYEKAGMKMLPVIDRDGRFTGIMMVTYCLALLPVSLMPTVYGLADRFYFYGALALGILYLSFAIVFLLSETKARARQLLRVSLVYLPCLFALLILDPATVPV